MRQPAWVSTIHQTVHTGVRVNPVTRTRVGFKDRSNDATASLTGAGELSHGLT